MREHRHRACLADEPVRRLVTPLRIFVYELEELEGDHTMQVAIERFVDLAHTTGADQTLDLIALDHRGRQRWLREIGVASGQRTLFRRRDLLISRRYRIRGARHPAIIRSPLPGPFAEQQPRAAQECAKRTFLVRIPPNLAAKRDAIAVDMARLAEIAETDRGVRAADAALL